MQPIAIYVRLSQARPGVEATAIDRQVRDCKAWLGARGWPVGEVYEDRDLSAFRKGVHRPSYERLLKNVAAGMWGGIVVWKLDRLLRSPREFERCWSVLEEADAILASVNDPVDTSSPVGLAIVRLLIVFAGLESETLSLRRRSLLADQAKAGRPHSGGRRTFGYDRDGATILEAEAEGIRWAAAELLGGRSLRSVTMALNARGLYAPSGQPWAPSKLGRALRGPHLAGIRVHRGATHPGGWTPILDEQTHLELAALLAPGADRPAQRGHRVHLLAGLLACGAPGEATIGHIEGICGAPMWVRYRRPDERRYGCVPPPTGRGCGKVAITAGYVEDLVVETVLQALEGGKLQALLDARAEGDPADLARRVADDDRQLRELARLHGQRKIGLNEWLAAREPIEARIEQARRALDRRASAGVLAGVTPATLRAEWARWAKAGDTDRQRALLELAVAAVVVRKGRPGYNKPDPDRIDPVWKV
jgi:site-specific DNA recombinase